MSNYTLEVGTLKDGEWNSARRGHGFYIEQNFGYDPYEDQVIELTKDEAIAIIVKLTALVEEEGN